jgi:hypothetical protein
MRKDEIEKIIYINQTENVQVYYFLHFLIWMIVLFLSKKFFLIIK